MRLSPLFLLSTSVAASVISHTVYNDNDYIAVGCMKGLESVATFCSGKSSGYTCGCTNEAELGSWITCGYQHTSEYNTGIEDSILDLCSEKGVTRSSLRAQYVNASKYIVSVNGNITDPIIYYPIDGTTVDDGYMGYYIGYKARYGNVAKSHELGYGFLGVVGVLVIISGLINWTFRLVPYVTKTKNSFFDKYMLTPAIHLKHGRSTLIGNIPDRFETICIVALFLFTLFSCFILGFSWDSRDAVFTKQEGYARYFGDRSGIIMIYQIPLLFLFTGRNNFLQFITRWKYCRFITFHKWLSRAILVEIIIHSVSFALQSKYYGITATRMATLWYRMGIVSASAYALAVMLASYVFRRFSYGLFIIVHIILVIVIIISMYYHELDQEYQYYAYACIAIWAFEHFVGIIRKLLFGVQTARAEIIDGSFIKVTMNCPTYWKSRPGSHAYVTFLTPTTFFRSNPFTVVQIGNQVQFFCRVKNGATNRVAKFLRTHNTVKVLVEGPYGLEFPYFHYDKAVFIATGNGFPGVYPQARSILESDSSTQVKIYWSLRDKQLLDCYNEEISQLERLGCKIIVAMTEPINDSSSSDDEKNSVLNMTSGRFDYASIVDEESRDGTVAFGTCCVPAVCGRVREAVAGEMRKGPRVDYYEESQFW